MSSCRADRRRAIGKSSSASSLARPAKYVSEADAMSHVAGYCVVNDLSERAFQLEGTGQWVKGKSADTFGPIGPWLVTADEVPDCQNLGLWLEVDGHRYQDGTTKTMVFGVQYLVSYLSTFMSLQPGDIITTGTPPGVGSWQEAAGVSQRRQRDAARRRGPGRAAAAGAVLKGVRSELQLRSDYQGRLHG